MSIELTNESYEQDKYRHLQKEFNRDQDSSIFKNILNLTEESWSNDEILEMLKKIMLNEPDSIKAYGLTEELINRYLKLIDKEINNQHGKELNEVEKNYAGIDLSEKELKELIRQELFSKCENNLNIKNLVPLVERKSESGDLIINQVKKYFGHFDLDSRLEIIENIKECKQYLDSIINYAISDMKEDQIIEVINKIKNENSLVTEIVNKLLYNKGVDDYSTQIIEKITPALIEANNDEALKVIFNKLSDDKDEDNLLKLNKILAELPIFYHKDTETIYLRPWLLSLRNKASSTKERNRINHQTREEIEKVIES